MGRKNKNNHCKENSASNILKPVAAEVTIGSIQYWEILIPAADRRDIRINNQQIQSRVYKLTNENLKHIRRLIRSKAFVFFNMRKLSERNSNQRV